MHHIFKAMERLLSAVEHRIFKLRVWLYYRRTGTIPPGALVAVCGVSNTPRTWTDAYAYRTPGCEVARNAHIAAIAHANKMAEIAAASLAAGYRIVQAGDTP